MGTTADDWNVTGNLTVTGTTTQTGVATFTGRPIVPTVAFGDLGSAASVGAVCYCATGNAGNPGLLVADGTNWITGAGIAAAES